MTDFRALPSKWNDIELAAQPIDIGLGCKISDKNTTIASALLDLRSRNEALANRLEALEQQSTCRHPLQVPFTPEAAPVATDADLTLLFAVSGMGDRGRRAIYELGRQHGAAQPPAAAKPLSPTAQAARDHFLANVPISLEHGLAAALCAVADQVVPDGPRPSADSDYHLMQWSKSLDQYAQRQQTRAELLAIAAELEQTQ